MSKGEEKLRKRRGPGYNVSGPRDISGEIALGWQPTPKGKPTPDPNAESKKAVEKARKS